MSEQGFECRLLSISEAAKILKVGRNTVLRLINQGRLGTIQIGQRDKVSYAELERFLVENTVRQSFLQRRFTSFEDNNHHFEDKSKKDGFDGIEFIKEMIKKESNGGQCINKG